MSRSFLIVLSRSVCIFSSAKASSNWLLAASSKSFKHALLLFRLSSLATASNSTLLHELMLTSKNTMQWYRMTAILQIRDWQQSTWYAECHLQVGHYVKTLPLCQDFDILHNRSLIDSRYLGRQVRACLVCSLDCFIMTTLSLLLRHFVESLHSKKLSSNLGIWPLRHCMSWADPRDS